MQKYNKSFRNYAGGLWFRLCSYASADSTLDGNIFTVKAAGGVANVTLRAGFAANSASGVTVDSPESDARRAIGQEFSSRGGGRAFFLRNMTLSFMKKFRPPDTHSASRLHHTTFHLNIFCIRSRKAILTRKAPTQERL